MDRLAALDRYRMLDTGPETVFDDIVKVAAQICGVPMALISFVDDRRQWFKAAIGLNVSETPLSVAFCAHAIQEEETFIVTNAAEDPRFSGNPLVTGDPNLRFYAGAQLQTSDGFPLGTLCVLDRSPRELTPEQLQTLEVLARQVVTQLELRRALAEKSTSEKRNQLILDSAIDYGIITLDIKGFVTSWNEGAFRVFGWTETEMLGELCDKFFTEQDCVDGVPDREMGAALARGRGSDERWHVRRDGSQFWASGEMMPLTDDDDKPIGFLKIVRDRTEKRNLEQAMQEQNATLEQRIAEEVHNRTKTEEALRQAQKMEALGQLTGGIAHDFNNMLTGIIGSLDIIRRRIATGRIDEMHRFMDAATGSAQRAAALTHRLLAFARLQPLDTKPNDLNQLIYGMAELLHRTIGERIALDMLLAGDVWPAATDANQFESALLNLTINARDAMPDGGRLTIATRNIELDERYSQTNVDVTAGSYVEVSVTDSGVGMPKEVIAKAFDPFFTTKPIGQVTGLGLSMIYGFAKQSGGHLRIYSQIGKGTTVKLYVPRALKDMHEEVVDKAQTPLGEGETVLVVEDDATVLLFVADVLEELGYKVLKAKQASVAIPLLRATGRIDLLITDVGLPDINGRQLAEIALQARAGIKVLFMTGYAENIASRGGLLEAGMDIISKPFAIEELAIKARRMIDR
jgi:PAS domain S-box-containing protein